MCYAQRLLLVLALACCASPAAAQIPPVAERAATLDSVLTVLHADGLFDGVLLIGEQGETVYQQALGDLADEPLTTATPLPLASVEKAITATAVLSLVEDERVNLDASVGRYLDAWPYPAITVRHLLNQTSGLHFLTTINAHADTTGPVTNANVLALVAEHRPGVAFEAGTAFRYDNANYVALVAVIEAVTGQRYPEVVVERVFRPAGVDDARVEPAAGWLQWFGGTMMASADDLLAFDHALASGEVLDAEMVEAMHTPPTFPDSTVSSYGFGRFLTDYPIPLIGHFGEGDAAKTGLWREQDGGATYVILMPGDAIHRTAILTAVLQLWNGQSYTLPTKRPVADVPEAVLARYVGIYESGMGRLHITLEDSGLHLEPEGAGGSEPLIPASERVFYFGHQDLTWEFVLDASEEVVGLMVQGQPETLSDKVE